MKKRLLYLLVAVAIAVCTALAVSIPSFAQDGDASVALCVDWSDEWIEFDTFDGLLLAVTEGEYSSSEHRQIRLLRDITLTEALVFSEGTYEIWFDGHTLTADSSVSEEALVYVTGTAYVSLRGFYEFSDANYSGGIDADGLAALYLGGEHEGSASTPTVDVYDCELSADYALILGECEPWTGSYAYVMWGAVLRSDAGATIISEQLPQECLPTLYLDGGEFVPADTYPAVDVCSNVIVSSDLPTETYIRTASAPNVLEVMQGYSNVHYICSEDFDIEGNILPYGYYVSTGEGSAETRLAWDSDGVLSLSAGDEFFIGRFDGYYQIEIYNYVADNTDRVLDGQIIQYYTERQGNTVGIRIFPSVDVPANSLGLELVDSLGNDVDFTYEVTEFEGSEVVEVTFTMPSDNVFFSVDSIRMAENHTITKIDCELGGDFNIDRDEAAFGDTVTVTLSPDSGFVMSDIYNIPIWSNVGLTLSATTQLYFTNADCDEVALPLTYTFEMPDEDVQVGVEYTEGCFVYFRAPATEQWSDTARLIYRTSESSNSYYIANYDTVEVDGETLYIYILPSEAHSFFFQNYMTGTPSHLIPVGPAYSEWNTPEANRVYEFMVADSNPYDDLGNGTVGGGESDSESEGGATGGDIAGDTGGGTAGGDTTTEGEIGGSVSGSPEDGGTAGGDTGSGTGDGPEGGAESTTPDDTTEKDDGTEEFPRASALTITISTVVVILICIILLLVLLLKDGNFKDLRNIFRD